MVTVVIGTRNRLSMLKSCLEPLMGGISVQHETVVVDAGSNDGTTEYVQGLPGVRLVCDGEAIGQARSLNRVFRLVESKYSCWLSDDNVLVPGMLDVAVQILESEPTIGLVALKTKDVRGAYVDAPYIGGLTAAGILTCNQGVIRTQLFREVGFFDETFRDYGIDQDLTAKVLLAGYRVVYTKEVAIHHYRDYASAPGAIPNQERATRMQAATTLYEQKYARLTERNALDHLATGLSKLLYSVVSLARRAMGTESLLGYGWRDWYNVTHSRHISKLDWLYTRGKPYYLVQCLSRR